MAFKQSKLGQAAQMGIDLPDNGGVNLSPSRGEIGKEIQRRAKYGRVTPESIQIYLDTLRECGIIVKAAFAANLSYSSIANLRKRDAEFAEEEEAAKQMFIAEKIDAPFQKFGLEGVNRIIIDKHGNRHEGEKVVQPQMALAFARKMDPAYRDKQEVDHKHTGGVMIVTAKVEEQTLEAYARQMESEKQNIVDGTAKPLPNKDEGSNVARND